MALVTLKELLGNIKDKGAVGAFIKRTFRKYKR